MGLQQAFLNTFSEALCQVIEPLLSMLLMNPEERQQVQKQPTIKSKSAIVEVVEVEILDFPKAVKLHILMTIAAIAFNYSQLVNRYLRDNDYLLKNLLSYLHIEQRNETQICDAETFAASLDR